MTRVYFTPKQLGEFTLPQLLCLMNEKLSSGQRIESAAAYMELVEARKKEEEGWLSDR